MGGCRWGTVKPGKREKFPVLRQVQIPVISNDECKKSYKKLAGLESVPLFDDKIVCTGGGKKRDKDTCQGDSGGPIMLPIHTDGSFPFYQIGIISHSDGCAESNTPGVNTNVQYYAKWIEERINVNGFQLAMGLQPWKENEENEACTHL